MEPDFLREMLILKLGQEKCKMSQEHLIGAGRICSKYDEHKSKDIEVGIKWL